MGTILNLCHQIKATSYPPIKLMTYFKVYYSQIDKRKKNNEIEGGGISCGCSLRPQENIKPCIDLKQMLPPPLMVSKQSSSSEKRIMEGKERHKHLYCHFFLTMLKLTAVSQLCD